jgi:hypothetical protein
MSLILSFFHAKIYQLVQLMKKKINLIAGRWRHVTDVSFFIFIGKKHDMMKVKVIEKNFSRKKVTAHWKFAAAIFHFRRHFVLGNTFSMKNVLYNDSLLAKKRT